MGLAQGLQVEEADSWGNSPGVPVLSLLQHQCFQFPQDSLSPALILIARKTKTGIDLAE